MNTNDKFQRFLEMTDHPERFSDEELMQLAHDPEMAAWYEALSDVEAAAKQMPQAKPRSRSLKLVVSWIMATAAAVLFAFLLWPKDKQSAVIITPPASQIAEAPVCRPPSKSVPVEHNTEVMSATRKRHIATTTEQTPNENAEDFFQEAVTEYSFEEDFGTNIKHHRDQMREKYGLNVDEQTLSI